MKQNIRLQSIRKHLLLYRYSCQVVTTPGEEEQNFIC